MITEEWVDITPEIARHLLKKNKRNRNLNEKRVLEYANAMKKGEWEETHQGIGIYEDGNIADGQTRLNAIIISNQTIRMRISKGIKIRSGIGIDDHRPRSIKDIIRISHGDNWFSNERCAVIRMLLFLKVGSRRASANLFMDIATDSIRKRIDFAVSSIPKRKGFSTAAIHSAVSTAYGYETNEDIIDFCQILKTGICTTEEKSAAIRFRDFVNMNVEKISSTSLAKKDAFLRCQNALNLFGKRKVVKRLIPAKDFVYPIYI